MLGAGVTPRPPPLPHAQIVGGRVHRVDELIEELEVEITRQELGEVYLKFKRVEY